MHKTLFNEDVAKGNFETLLILDLTFVFFLFTKREIEALTSDAGSTQFPEMVPNRQVKKNYCFSFLRLINQFLHSQMLFNMKPRLLRPSVKPR